MEKIQIHFVFNTVFANHNVMLVINVGAIEAIDEKRRVSVISGELHAHGPSHDIRIVNVASPDLFDVLMEEHNLFVGDVCEPTVPQHL